MSIPSLETTLGRSVPDQTASRTAWADAAKGVCILLVVLWHVIMKQYLRVEWHLPVPLPGLWGAFGDLLLPLRMPLFFTISGMFAVGAVRRSWPTVFRSKIIKFLYLYLLWLLVHTAVLALVPDFDTARATDALELIEQLTVTPSNLWYLFALAAYFAIAKVTRHLPVAVVLGPALLMSVIAAAELIPTPGNRAWLLQNLVFFLAGLHLRPAVERLAVTTSWRRTALTGGLYGLAVTGMTVAGAQTWVGVRPAVSIIATVFGVTAAAQIAARWGTVTRALASLGRRTLPIYVIHMPLVALTHAALVGPLSEVGPLRQFGLALVTPIMVSVVIVGLCLALHQALRRTGAGWLFELPGVRRRTSSPGGHATSATASLPGPGSGR